MRSKRKPESTWDFRKQAIERMTFKTLDRMRRAHNEDTTTQSPSVQNLKYSVERVDEKCANVSPRMTESIEVSHPRRYESREPQGYTLSTCNETQNPNTWATPLPQPSPPSYSHPALSLALNPPPLFPSPFPSLVFFLSRSSVAFKFSPIGSNGIVHSERYLVANSNTAKAGEPVLDEPFE